MSTTPETLPQSPENNLEAIGESARDQLERLDNTYEKRVERGPESGEKREQDARHEALESAVSVEAGGAERTRRGADPAPGFQRGPITKKQRDDSFKATMQDVQEQLPLPSRTFSKIIHNKTVEKVSDGVGTTIARPNAILAGAIVAFLATTVLYYIAKNIGYRLSGFETIGAFIVGWVIGLLFDYFRVMVTGKHS